MASPSGCHPLGDSTVGEFEEAQDVETTSYQRRCDVIIIHLECEGGIEKSIPIGSPIGIRRLAEWWQTVTARDWSFYPIHTRIMDSFSCSPLNTAFYFEKRKKVFRKSLIRWDATWWRHPVNVIMTSRIDACAVPEGGIGGLDPPGKSQVIWVSIEISI